MALNKLYIFVAANFLNIVQNHGYENHLICKSVQDVFTPASNDRFASGVSQGRPGKRGVPGVKGEAGRRGEKGDEGSPAIVDYQRIEHVIERTTTERLSCIQNGGYVNSRNCYTAIFASANWEKAVQLCEGIGGKPADIHNLEEQNRIAHIARSNIAEGAYKQFWLGMSYQPSTNTLLTSNATVTTSNFRWYPGYPRRTTSHTSMIVEVKRNVNDAKQGLFNLDPSATGRGVICMKPITKS